MTRSALCAPQKHQSGNRIAVAGKAELIELEEGKVGTLRG